MSSLHMVYSSEGYSRVKDLTEQDDDLVLLGDGVYEECEDAYNLDADVQARGIDRSRVISYARLVELTLEHKKVVSWP